MNLRISLIATIISSLLLSASAYGQGKLSSGAISRMIRFEKDLANPISRSAAEADTVLATVEFTSPSSVDSLENMGIEVLTTFGDFAIVRLPLVKALRAVDVKGIRSIDFGTEATPQLDQARRYTDVNAVHKGEESVRSPYTGKDVVVGVVDTGLDPLHPSFLDTDGNLRVSFFENVTATGLVRKAYTREEMEKIGTDSKTDTHGTHVTGIAAGSRLADGVAHVPIYSEPDADGKVSIKEIGPGEFPYYGVAPDADIMMGGGDYTTSGLLLNVKNIIDEAKATGKPTVVNLSFGYSGGPHDGSGTFSRGVAELGRDAIIVVAAGNEGEEKNSVRSYISANSTFRTLIDLNGATVSDKVKTGMFEFFTDTQDKDVSANFIGVNRNTGETVFSIPIYENFSPDLGETSYYPFDDDDIKTLKRYFNIDNIGGVVRTSTDNGNRMVMVYLTDLYTFVSNRYVSLGVEIKSAPGVKIEGYFSGDHCIFTDGGLSGYTPGTTDMTISDMATGSNIISVGSYNSRNSMPCLDLLFRGWNEESVPLLETSYFSSYGIFDDGRTLPHVSAPGMALVSSLSRYYTDGDSFDDLKTKASAYVPSEEPGGKDAYYQYMLGTSMAAPFVTGVVALWLEADPELKVDDILDIINKTSVKDDHYDAVKMGAGRINALAGLKEVLSRRYGSGVGTVSADMPGEAVITVAGGTASAYMAGASTVTLSAFTPAGTLAARSTAHGSEATLDTSSLAPGFYILTATDGHRSSSQKISIR